MSDVKQCTNLVKFGAWNSGEITLKSSHQSILMVFKSQNLGLNISSNKNTKKKEKKRKSQTYEDATAPSSVSIWELLMPWKLQGEKYKSSGVKEEKKW